MDLFVCLAICAPYNKMPPVSALGKFIFNPPRRSLLVNFLNSEQSRRRFSYSIINCFVYIFYVHIIYPITLLSLRIFILCMGSGRFAITFLILFLFLLVSIFTLSQFIFRSFLFITLLYMPI